MGALICFSAFLPSSTFCPFLSLLILSFEVLDIFSFLFYFTFTNAGSLLLSWGTDTLFFSSAKPLSGLPCWWNPLWVLGILGRGTITFSIFWGAYKTEGLISIRAARSLLSRPYFLFPVGGRLKKLFAPFFIPTCGVLALLLWGDSSCFSASRNSLLF